MDRKMFGGMPRRVDHMGRIGAEDNSAEVVLTPELSKALKGNSGSATVKWSKDGDKLCIHSIGGVMLGGDIPNDDDEEAEGEMGGEQDIDEGTSAVTNGGGTQES